MRSHKRPSGLKSFLFILALVAILAVPAICLMFTPLAPGAGAAMPGAIVATLAVLIGGVRRGLIVTVWAVIALGIAPAGLQFSALGVFFIVCIGASTGFAAYRGMDMPVLVLNSMVALTMLNPPSLTSSEVADGVHANPKYVVTLMAVTALGAFWSFATMCLLRTKLPHLPLVPLHREPAIVYGATLAFLTGIVGAVALTWFQYSLVGWTILTIYMVIRPTFKGTDVTHGMRKKAAHRAVGTVGGVIIAAALAAVIHNPNALVIAGIVFLVVAVYLQLVGVPYWEFVILLTPAMVFMDGSGQRVDRVAVIRILCTFVGIALAMGALEFHRRYTSPWLEQSKFREARQGASSS